MIPIDYFVQGLPADMQVALQSLEKCSACDLNKLADETTRFELAEIRSYPKEAAHTSSINSVTPNMPLSTQALYLIEW